MAQIKLATSEDMYAYDLLILRLAKMVAYGSCVRDPHTSRKISSVRSILFRPTECAPK